MPCFVGQGIANCLAAREKTCCRGAGKDVLDGGWETDNMYGGNDRRVLRSATKKAHPTDLFPVATRARISFLEKHRAV